MCGGWGGGGCCGRREASGGERRRAAVSEGRPLPQRGRSRGTAVGSAPAGPEKRLGRDPDSEGLSEEARRRLGRSGEHLGKVLPLGEGEVDGLGVVVVAEEHHVADELCVRISSQHRCAGSDFRM